MLRLPSQPSSKRAIVLVYWNDAWTCITEERAVGEDESEVGKVFYKRSRLCSEDFGGYTTAVET